MRTKYTIEVIVDMRDKDKMPAIETAIKRETARLNAVVQLLADGQRPHVSCFSDDFFAGQTELDYLAEEFLPEPTPAKVEPAPLSDEFLKALKGE